MKIENWKLKINKKACPTKPWRSRGFTLAELLVVIAIMVLLTGISTTAIVFIRKERKIEAVAEEVKNYLIQARSYAIAPSQAGVTSVVFNIDTSKVLTVKEIKAGGDKEIIKKTLPS